MSAKFFLNFSIKDLHWYIILNIALQVSFLRRNDWNDPQSFRIQISWRFYSQSSHLWVSYLHGTKNLPLQVPVKETWEPILNHSILFSIKTMSNISAYVCEVIEKVAANLKSNNKIPEFSTSYLSLETVRILINNVISEEESVSVYNAPVLLSYLTTVPFTLPEEE